MSKGESHYAKSVCLDCLILAMIHGPNWLAINKLVCDSIRSLLKDSKNMPLKCNFISFSFQQVFPALCARLIYHIYFDFETEETVTQTQKYLPVRSTTKGTWSRLAHYGELKPWQTKRIRLNYGSWKLKFESKAKVESINTTMLTTKERVGPSRINILRAQPSK